MVDLDEDCHCWCSVVSRQCECIAVNLDEDSVIAGAQSSVISVSVSRWTWMKTVSLLVRSHQSSV